MPTKLQVINRAFSHLGEAGVSNITDDPAPPNVVKAIERWDEVVDTGLSKHPWLCALERSSIARTPTLAEDPVNGADGDFKYDYVFKLPVNVLRVFYVDDCGERFRWERSTVIQGPFVGRPIIRAEDAGPLRVAYVRRTIPELWTPLLGAAIALDLASQLAGPIQSDATKEALLAKRAAQKYLEAAGAECGEEGGQDPVIPSPLAQARLGAGRPYRWFLDN